MLWYPYLSKISQRQNYFSLYLGNMKSSLCAIVFAEQQWRHRAEKTKMNFSNLTKTRTKRSDWMIISVWGPKGCVFVTDHLKWGWESQFLSLRICFWHWLNLQIKTFTLNASDLSEDRDFQKEVWRFFGGFRLLMSTFQRICNLIASPHSKGWFEWHLLFGVRWRPRSRRGSSHLRFLNMETLWYWLVLIG